MMKKVIISSMSPMVGAGVFLLFWPQCGLANQEWASFYPLNEGNHWVFSVTRNGKAFVDNVTIAKSYLVDENRYYVMRSDANDVEYHLRHSEDGIYVIRRRYPMPFFRLFMYTVVFKPPIKILSYPLEVGKKWKYVGRGSVWFLKHEVNIAFEVKEKGIRRMKFGDVEYYLISARTDDDGNVSNHLYTYGRGYGYMGGCGPEQEDVLTDYRPGLEKTEEVGRQTAKERE